MTQTETTAVQGIAEARARIADLLLEIDSITLQVNPRIKADYATKIGYLENDLLKWQLAARRARRRCALAQARANAGQPFDSTEFDEQLDAELAEWHALLQTCASEFLAAVELKNGSRPLSPLEVREMKALHRELIKRLHPDLHPDRPSDQVRLFMAAQAAYERGDLDTLRALAVATEHLVGGDSAEGLSEDEAAAELELVLAQERVLGQQLEEIKRSEPYTLGEKLADGAWVIRRTNELKRQIQEQKDAAAAYDARFDELARRSCNGC